MTVGNWSDVVSGGNDDWSEEDLDHHNLIQSKVFVPTGRTITELDEPTPVNKSSLNEHSSPRQPQEFVRKEQAGAQILQSLQHQPVVQQTQSPQQIPPTRSAAVQQQQQPQQQVQPQQQQPNYASQSLNRQAAESIKSLVGISTGQQFPSGQPQQQSLRNDATKVGGVAPNARLGQGRRTRIPETAVEMPTNDAVASMGVQFGAIDISTLGNVFGNDVAQSFKPVDNFEASQMKPQSQILNQGPPNLQKQQLINPSVYEQKSTLQNIKTSEDLMKSLGAKPSESIDPRTGVKHNVNPKVTDLYSSGQQHQEQFKQQQPQHQQSFGGSNAYGTQFNSSYGQQQSYNAYQTSSNTAGGQSVQKTSMKELDNPRVQPSSYDLPSSGAGLVNSTQTTNVLKNSLPATGKQQQPQGMTNRTPSQMQHFMPPPGVPQPGFYYHPVYEPLQMPGHSNADSNQFAGGYNHLSENKFGRQEATDVSSSVSTGQSTQNPVVSQSHQPFMGQAGPPGYSVYYMPPPMMTPQGYFIPPASSAQIPPPTGFAKNNYGSHSGYGANMYEGTGISLPSNDYGMKPTAPYGQSAQQNVQSKSLSTGVGSDLMSGSTGSSTQQSYGKPHGQTTQKVSQPPNMTHSSPHHSMTVTDRLLSSSLKMNYAAGNQGYNLTGNQSYGNSYMAPPMNQGFNDGNQGQNRPGMSAGPKVPPNTNKGGYGQNLYSNNW
jgi:hypothetical protein